MTGRAPGTSKAPAATAPATEDELPATPIAWEPCGSIQCGTLSVPLDWQHPQEDGAGERIDLAVARRPAADPTRRIGTLFFNPGGPGASGINYLRAAGLDRTLDARFDIVTWDPRGIGSSRAIRCDEDAPEYRELDWGPDDEAEQAALDATAERIAVACAEADPDLLGHVATDDTVRDLDRLRAAVGDEQLTFMGFSYGTYIGLRYAELFPTRVRAIVLDGVVDPDEDLQGLLAGQTRALEARMTEVFASCRPPSCTLGDAAAAYDRVAARVEVEPLPAGPATLGPSELAFAAVSASYDDSLGSQFLLALAAADRGQGTQMLQLAQRYWSSGSYSAYLAVVCTDSPHPEGSEGHRELARHLDEISPRFGEAIANEVLPCAFWRAPTTGRAEPVHATGAATILVVGNTGDVATPIEAARRVASELDDAALLTYEGEGHTSFGKSTCVDLAISTYLIERSPPAEGTVCAT